MSISYAENRIREALKHSQGNMVKTRKLLNKWCSEDHRLLQALTSPHMTGILAHAIERVSNKIARGEPAPLPEATVHNRDEDDVDFGKELLKNFAMGDPAKFAQESFSAPVKKKKASQSHIDAIHLLARKSKGS